MADYVSFANLDGIRASIEAKNNLINSLKNNIERLEGENRMLQESWEGDAENAYTGGIWQDIQALRDLTEKLKAVVQHEELAVSEYSHAEDNALSIIDSLKR